MSLNYKPLAELLRPQSLADFIGQEHLLGQDGIFDQFIKNDTLPSFILWGPPGVGKTSLVQLVAKSSGRKLYELSAPSASVKDIKTIVSEARCELESLFIKKSPILFIDEIHRLNKAQQDSFLQAVERGWITLIGATTENPSFEVISALLSRTQIYVLKPLNQDSLLKISNKAIQSLEQDLKREIKLENHQALFRMSGGDARKLLNIIEIIAKSSSNELIIINDSSVYKAVHQKALYYDKKGSDHYDMISAFIKSIRGSDPNASVYWLARMLAAGEDIKFIARRLIIAASEEIGIANPTALVLATNTFEAISVVGLPEARIILSQCTVYLANSVKSNASYMAIIKAQELVKQTGDLEVPLHLRNAPTELMQELEYGKNYQYSHDYEQNFSRQEYMPSELSGTKLYEPSDNVREQKDREHLRKLWHQKYHY